MNTADHDIAFNVIIAAVSLVVILIVVFSYLLHISNKKENEKKGSLDGPQHLDFESGREKALKLMIKQYGAIHTVDRYCQYHTEYKKKYVSQLLSSTNQIKSPKALQQILDNLAPREFLVDAA